MSSHLHDVKMLNVISTARDPDFAAFRNVITKTSSVGVVYCRYGGMERIKRSQS